tara:strand:+ start:584 stop:1303 length:720 start_codon:yes stop_codon:yes gene_type:complete
MNKNMVKKILPFIKLMRQYHKHEVHGIENIPKSGKALLVVNHSLATYDILLLFAAIYENSNRYTKPLADRLFFKSSVLGQLAKDWGAVEGSPENAHNLLLEKKELVAVAPGGMKEALRPSSQRYQINWEKRKGFIRLAVETQTPIILAMCPKADDLYHVYPSSITDWAYTKYKIPLMIARGFGPTAFPRKIKLTHFISESIFPPNYNDKKPSEKLIDDFHKKIMKRSEEMIASAILKNK